MYTLSAILFKTKCLFCIALTVVTLLQDSTRFGHHIQKAMLDIQALFHPENNKKMVGNGEHVQLMNGKKHL